MTAPAFPRLRLRIVLASGQVFGPGKADLLEGIAEEGSIAAAGRRMGMSYKRAWQLVDGMNGAFQAPLVASAKGGKAGGGAQLTLLGADLLARYRAMERAARAAATDDLAVFAKALEGKSD